MTIEHVRIIHGPGAESGRPGLLAAPRNDDQLQQWCWEWGAEVGLQVNTVRTGDEAALRQALVAAGTEVDAIVLQAGPLAYTAEGLGAAVRDVGVPVVEVEVRDASRVGAPASLLGPACVRTIHGRGADGFRWALHHLAHRDAWPTWTVNYGEHRAQVGDLRPATDPGPHPVAVLIHGGFWLQPWERDTMEALAVDLAWNGVTTWNLEYRRIGGDGGWPTSAEDVLAGIDHLVLLETRYGLDLDRVTFIGHSAGAQLAVWAAARATAGFARVRPARIVTLGGLLDLRAAREAGLGGRAVNGYIGDRDIRLAEASPVELVPLATPQLIAHGLADELVPPNQSHAYVRAARTAGDRVDLVELDGAGHFDLIDPRTPAWLEIVDRLGGW